VLTVCRSPPPVRQCDWGVPLTPTGRRAEVRTPGTSAGPRKADSRAEGILWSTCKCTAPQLASLHPPPGKFHTSATGYPRVQASQQAGANLADKKPVSLESYPVAEFQPYEQICYFLYKNLVQIGKITIFQHKVNKTYNRTRLL
jgi:hypothetical protein